MIRHPRALFVLLVATLALAVAWLVLHPDDGPRRTDAPRDPAVIPDAEAPAGDPPRLRVTGAETPIAEPTLPELTVRVLLPGRVPLADADLRICRPGAHSIDVPQQIARARTDADGRAAFPLVPGRTYEVRGTHADRLVSGIEFDHGDEGTALTLEAGVGPRLVVTVTDGDGTVVPGAQVWESQSASGAIVSTDEAGEADIGRVYPDNPFVVVQADGFETWSNFVGGFWSGDDPLRVGIRLRAATPVRVRVTEADGSPVAGALVRTPEARGLTDPEGEIALAVGEFGKKTWLRAGTPNGREAVSSLPAPPDPGEVTVLVLPAPTSIQVEVVHAWTGAPIAGAVVRRSGQSGWEDVGTSGADGRLDVEVAREGRVGIVAFAPGLAPFGDDWDGGVDPDDDGIYRVTLAPTSTVTGRVVDSTGEPVSGATCLVTARDESLPLGTLAVETTTDASGRFELRGVPATNDLVVLATHDGRTSWNDLDRPLELQPDAATDVGDITLPAGFRLDVPIVDDDEPGTPVPAAIVWVRWRVVARGMPSVHRFVVDGRMDPIERVPRDGAVVEITGPGLLPTIHRVNAATERIVAGRACEVVGRLVDGPTGDPFPGAVRVRIESTERLHTMEGNHGSAETDADGAFEITGVRRGRYRLVVRTGDGGKLPSATTHVDVTATRTEVGAIAID